MAAPGAPDRDETRRPRRVSRGVELALTLLASVVFVVLWVYVVLVTFTDSTIPADTWAWLSGLDTIAAVIVWILILPVAVYLWAWQADPGPLIMGVIMVGLVGWSLIAWSGLGRAVFRRD